MIIDSHCHAWTYWPYQPPVPDAETRPRIEQLLHEMDTCGVERAAVVCAQIEHNPENNAYIAQQAERFPLRLFMLADLDSEWSSTYHSPESAMRLRQMAEQYPIKGFTHYLAYGDDGSWLYSEEGLDLLRTAADLGLLASLSIHPHQQAALRKAAERVPALPILCHHLGGVKVGDSEALREVLASAELPNIYIKLSGFAYAARINWEYPYTEVQEIVRAEYEHFGPRRMCWGSDYPVVRYFMTYRQSLEAFRMHCTFVPEEDKEWILGKTLGGLLGVA